MLLQSCGRALIKAETALDGEERGQQAVESAATAAGNVGGLWGKLTVRVVEET